jgi:hypothetical protein
MSDSGAVKAYLDVNISSKNALACKLEISEIDRSIFNPHRFHNRIKRYANGVCSIRQCHAGPGDEFSAINLGAR